MNINIANRLTFLRELSKLSREELAGKLGVSLQDISNWEEAQTSPNAENLLALAEVYGMSLDEILMPEKAKAFNFSNKVMKKRTWRKFPYPVWVVIVYLVMGFSLDLWHPGWLMFLTIPLYYCLVEMFLED